MAEVLIWGQRMGKMLANRVCALGLFSEQGTQTPELLRGLRISLKGRTLHLEGAPR